MTGQREAGRHPGDDGSARLMTGGRISKSAAVFSALGDLDELNAVLGVLCSGLPGSCSDWAPTLTDVQRQLVEMGAFCAGAEADRTNHEAALSRLEGQLETLERELPELRQFILPGGHPAACSAHLARAVCRRAERSLVALLSDGADERRPQHPFILAYMNRLSSFLFALARLINSQTPCGGSHPSR